MQCMPFCIYCSVQILLDAGAIDDAKNEDEQTPLHLAANEGHVKVLTEILKRNREAVQDDDENANTALHLAALGGRTNCIKELIKFGANITARSVIICIIVTCTVMSTQKKLLAALISVKWVRLCIFSKIKLPILTFNSAV